MDAALMLKSTWVDYVKLGTLVQGGRELLVCYSRNNQRLFMLKDVSVGANSCMEKLATLRHRHIVLASFFIDLESTSYMAFEYTCHTLEELLHTHVTMNEDHIRAIALPVFEAMRYIHENSLLHGNVDVQSIRICGRSGTVVLGDCDACEEVAKPTNTDLEGLGIALLHCMEGSISDLNPTRVKECRASNKVFGLTDPERWSEHKQLVDFIDDIFSAQRRPAAKYASQHIYIVQGNWNPEVLVSLAELASLDEAMSFYSQNPLQYLPQSQSQHVNTLQPPFGPGSFSAYASAPSSFNEPPLPIEHRAFGTNEFASTSAQNYDQPQNTGFLRGLSGQLMQLEQRLEGRFQEIRIQAERAESSISKLENSRTLTNLPDQAMENCLEALENCLGRLDTSISSISKSLQTATKNLNELDMRAERSADDAYAIITLLIEIVTRQLQINMTERQELQQYQQQGERHF
ncbi:hypothetical protein Q7P37_009237 [Cladosporium fusiforme]